MFKYISEILKSFTPAQRITALLILVFSIIILTLGPSIIKTNTSSCDELVVRVKSQETQIIELNKRVNELNNELIQGQKECTDNLIAKQKEIMDIVNGMISDVELKKCETNRPKKLMKQVRNPDFSDSQQPEMRMEQMAPPPAPPIKESNDDMLNQLKALKRKIQKASQKSNVY